MSVKNRTQKRTSDYKSAFTAAEHKLMRIYGVGDLLDEIWLNRVMLLRTADKMNQEKERLTFRDHLDALRAVSYATGRIASLIEVREELSKPYQEVEDQYREHFEHVNEFVEVIGERILGHEKWEELQMEAFRQAVINEAALPKSLTSGRSKRKESR
jgi:hypothetical protein